MTDLERVTRAHAWWRGLEAGNASMRAGGRVRWNEADWRASLRAYEAHGGGPTVQQGARIIVNMKGNTP